ncbi:ABC transporter permease [Candidatus Paracaedibacter symbiosus]|uniref:ABC transporter permease n=1 Tax=Candidatus Paracaedibacter symbiosus TaxID=244582 RepID=UPI000509CAE5|nr:ABC transporter permease [Candidatus Paracaedibacter symbiosus]
MTFSPLMQRRLRQFKANRRGYLSLWIFCVFFLITLLAPLISNDKPIVVYYDQHFYFPIVKAYPETIWGGTFETETNYRDPYVKELITKKGWMVFPPIPYSFDTVNYDIPTPAPSAPTMDNWLGTDDQGRDVVARLIYGSRISILFGLALAVFSSIIGVAAGATQGYYGGTIDLILQRFTEIWSGLPILYLLIILSSMIEPNFWWLLLIMLLFSWMNLVAVVRAEFFRTRSLDYVRAAEALGVPGYRIIWRHILPNAMVATITYLPFIISASITTLTSLDFLGFGLPPGSASLGELLTQGKNNIQAPWLALTGFFSIALILSLLIFIGEAVRDAFDPRKVSVS